MRRQNGRGTHRQAINKANDGKDIHQKEVSVVPHPDAVPSKRTMVVHAEHTFLAETAVVRSRRLPVLTMLTKVWRKQDSLRLSINFLLGLLVILRLSVNVQFILTGSLVRRLVAFG